MTVDPRKAPVRRGRSDAPGHGPGIGGFKADSELGVAMAAGHPAYLIALQPRIRCRARPSKTSCTHEAVFLEQGHRTAPERRSKPCVVGNCQGGWSVLLVASIRPELFGPNHRGRLAAVVLGPAWKA
jgi:hypothetical protein